MKDSESYECFDEKESSGFESISYSVASRVTSSTEDIESVISETNEEQHLQEQLNSFELDFEQQLKADQRDLVSLSKFIRMNDRSLTPKRKHESPILPHTFPFAMLYSHPNPNHYKNTVESNLFCEKIGSQSISSLCDARYCGCTGIQCSAPKQQDRRRSHRRIKNDCDDYTWPCQLRGMSLFDLEDQRLLDKIRQRCSCCKENLGEFNGNEMRQQLKQQRHYMDRQRWSARLEKREANRLKIGKHNFSCRKTSRCYEESTHDKSIRKQRERQKSCPPKPYLERPKEKFNYEKERPQSVGMWFGVESQGNSGVNLRIHSASSRKRSLSTRQRPLSAAPVLSRHDRFCNLNDCLQDNPKDCNFPDYADFYGNQFNSENEVFLKETFSSESLKSVKDYYKDINEDLYMDAVEDDSVVLYQKGKELIAEAELDSAYDSNEFNEVVAIAAKRLRQKILMLLSSKAQSLQKIWKYFDREQAGKVDIDQFNLSLQGFGIDVSMEITEALVLHHISCCPSLIYFGDFCSFVMDPDFLKFHNDVILYIAGQGMSKERHNSWLEDAFMQSSDHKIDSIERKNCGRWILSEDDFAAGLVALGLELDEDNMKRLVLKYSADGFEGEDVAKIDIERFIKAIKLSTHWPESSNVKAEVANITESAICSENSELYVSCDVLHMAQCLGLCVETDSQLLWIAEAALQAPLPEGWKVQENDEGNRYFFHAESGTFRWDHPLISYYKSLCQRHKAIQLGSQEIIRNARDYKIGAYSTCPSKVPLKNEAIFRRKHGQEQIFKTTESETNPYKKVEIRPTSAFPRRFYNETDKFQTNDRINLSSNILKQGLKKRPMSALPLIHGMNFQRYESRSCNETNSYQEKTNEIVFDRPNDLESKNCEKDRIKDSICKEKILDQSNTVIEKIYPNEIEKHDHKKKMYSRGLQCPSHHNKNVNTETKGANEKSLCTEENELLAKLNELTDRLCTAQLARTQQSTLTRAQRTPRLSSPKKIIGAKTAPSSPPKTSISVTRQLAILEARIRELEQSKNVTSNNGLNAHKNKHTSRDIDCNAASCSDGSTTTFDSSIVSLLRDTTRKAREAGISSTDRKTVKTKPHRRKSNGIVLI